MATNDWNLTFSLVFLFVGVILTLERVSGKSFFNGNKDYWLRQKNTFISKLEILYNHSMIPEKFLLAYSDGRTVYILGSRSRSIWFRQLTSRFLESIRYQALTILHIKTLEYANRYLYCSKLNDLNFDVPK